MNELEFVTYIIRETKGDYRKMVALCRKNCKKPPKIKAVSPNGMGMFIFNRHKYLWYYEVDPYGFMDMVRVERAY